MTFPQGALDPIDAILFPVQTPDVGGATGIVGRYNLLQPFVENALKQRYVQDNPKIQNPLAAIYEGLPAGVPLPLGILMKLAEQITGIDVTVWVEQWQANPVVENIAAVTQDVLGKIFTVLAHLQALWESVNFLDPDFDPDEVWANVTSIVGAISDALSSWQVLPWQLGRIDLGSITREPRNLLAVGNFPNAASLIGNGIWTWDSDVSATADGTGSARTTADGTLKVLGSVKFDVDEGQEVPVAGRFRWAGLSYTGGSPLKLGVREFRADGTVTAETVVAVPTPGASSGGSFVTVSDVYETDAGVERIYVRAIVEPSASAGTVWFDGGAASKPNVPDWFQPILNVFNRTDLDDLIGADPAAIRTWFLSIVATPLNQVMDILAGLEITPIDEGMQAIKDWWVGVGSQFEDVAEEAQTAIDNFWSGLARQFGLSGKSSADVANIAAVVATDTQTSLEVGEWNNAILSLRNNKDLLEGVDETEEANFKLDRVWAASTPAAVISASSASVPVAYKRFAEDAKKGFITWFGKGIVGDLRLDVYRGDYTASEWELIHTSPNVAGATTSSWSYLQYNIANVIDRIDVYSGLVLGAAWRVVGAGTHEVAGIPYNQPEHPTIHPKRPVSVRTGSGDLAFGSTLYTPTSIPWFGIGIITGDVPPPYNAPRKTQYTASGTYTYNIPTWARLIDVVLCSASGGGHGGYGGAPISGQAGEPGEWVAETLERGVDFPEDATTLTIVVGAPGIYGGNEADGSAGGNTTRNAIFGGKAALVATGGPGGQDYASPSSEANGVGPGDFTYNDETYVGGVGGKGGSAGVGKDGTAPGGPGGGGAGYAYTIAWRGGWGSNGAAYLTARQD